MELIINKTYSLYTTHDTISAEKVLVCGILVYESTKAIPYDIRTLALNEKYSTDGDNALEKKTYFHCKTINAPYKEFVVWADIIDGLRTTMLGAEYGYSMAITIQPDSNANIQSVLSYVQLQLLEKYGTSVKAVFANTYIDEANEMSNMVNELNNYKELLAQFKQLERLIPTVNKLADFDYASAITAITATMTSVEERMAEIASALG